MQGVEYTYTCMYLKPGNTVRGGGGTQFPRELSPVNWFCTTRELGPGDRIPIRSAGPKIGPDRIPYDTGMATVSFGPSKTANSFLPVRQTVLVGQNLHTCIILLYWQRI